MYTLNRSLDSSKYSQLFAATFVGDQLCCVAGLEKDFKSAERYMDT
jgi:hypothetical protein